MSLFSTPSLTALVKVITGGPGFSNTVPIGVYRSGTELETFFGGLGLDLRIAGQSRVPAVRELLLRTNARPDGKHLIAKVIEAAADPREYLNTPDKLETVVDYLNDRLRLDGFELRKIDKRHRLVSVATNAQVASALKEKAADLNLDSVRRDFDRALDQAEKDPEDAITAACSTIESVCKCLLDELQQPYPSKQDIGGLVKEVQKHLSLSPGRPDLGTDIRQILGGLSAVTGGIGALRTHAGDAHGRGKNTVAADSRVARLAIHAASSVALFFIETWQDQKR